MLAELAMAAAGALGGAVATDSWGQIKAGVVRIFRQGGTPADTVVAWLIASEAQASVTTADEARELLQGQWQQRFGELLQAHPDLADEVRAFAEGAAAGPAHRVEQADVVQHINATEHAQQAVLARGVQHNTFHSTRE